MVSNNGRQPGGSSSDNFTLARQMAPFGDTGPPWNNSLGSETASTQSGNTASSGSWEISLTITPRAPSASKSKISTTLWLKTPSASSTLATRRSPATGLRSVTLAQLPHALSSGDPPESPSRPSAESSTSACNGNQDQQQRQPENDGMPQLVGIR